MNTKKLTVCVSTYNRYDYLQNTIQDLLTQSSPYSDYDIIIYDNSPSETHREQGYSMGNHYENHSAGNITYICDPIPGLSRAKNKCLSLTNTPYIHYVDDDIRVEDNFICNTIKAYQETGCASLGGKVIPEWEEEPPEWLSGTGKSLLSLLDYGEERIFLDRAQWIVGANTGYDTAVLKSLSGFREDLDRRGGPNTLLCNGDQQVTYALHEQGHKILYDPDCVVRHVIPKDRLQQKWFIKRYAWQMVSHFIGGDNQIPGPDQIKFIRNNIDTLFEHQATSQGFETRLSLVVHLTNLLLSGNVE